jgi:hypothetical protein
LTFLLVERDEIQQLCAQPEFTARLKDINEDFEKLLSELKAGMVNNAKRRCLYTNQSGSRVTFLLENISRQKFLKSLVPSSSTLIVIPNVLVEHWQVSSGSYTLC